MIQGPFAFLAAFLLLTVVCTVLLPLAVLIGYPLLLGIGLYYAGRWYAGHLDRPRQIAAVWLAYLGLIVILHGVLICFDTPLAGAPPTFEEKRLGTRLAYLGGAVAGISMVVAYTIELARPRAVKQEVAKDARIDDLVT